MNRFMVGLGLGMSLGWCVISGPASAQTPYRVRAATSTEATAGVSWHQDLDSGWAESIRRNVPMVIYITSDHCRYCDAMKRDTWHDASVQQDLKEGYVAIELSPRRSASTLARIRVRAYPTTLIGIPKGKIIAQRVGYQPAVAMRGLLREMKGRLARP